MKILSERLAWARERKGLTQAQLATRAGVAQSTIGNLEAGIRLTSRKIASIASALEVDTLWLSEGKGKAFADLNVIDQEMREVLSIPGALPAHASWLRKIPAYGKAMGGFPERVWDEDGHYPTGFSDVYAEIASADPNAFLTPIEGDSMSPRFNPGEYALVEPNTEPELEDDVLVRMQDGRTMIKRLLSRRGGIRLGSYSNQEIISAPPEIVVWMYYVAHPVPARKIKTRI